MEVPHRVVRQAVRRAMRPVGDILWDAVKESLYCSREDYVASLEGWTLSPIERDGVQIAIRIQKGPEFHFIMTGATKSVTRADIRACIQPIIDAHGYATTRTPREDVRQQRFNQALGFFKTGEDEFDIHYRIEKMHGGK